MPATIPSWPERPLDMMLLGSVWRYHALGDPLIDGFNMGGFERGTGYHIDAYHITRERFENTLQTFAPIERALQEHGITHDAAWDYLARVAPWSVQVIGNVWPTVDTIGLGA